MPLSIATLKAMIHEYHGLPLSDEEFERIRPEAALARGTSCLKMVAR